MGKRSTVSTLPRAVREWVDSMLVAKNFAGYEALAAELTAKGYQASKSSLHRYGQNVERRLSAIKASTEAARLIATEASDDEDDRSAAVISIIQTDCFEMLVALQDATEAKPAQRIKLLSTVAESIAKLSRASVNQKKWRTEVQRRLETAAASADKIAKKGGLSDEAAAQIRAKILGVVS